MILKALCDYYDILEASEESSIPKPGYSYAKISYGLVLAKDGSLKNIMDLRVSAKLGNKLVSKAVKVPEQPVRSGKNPPPYFLSDKSDYVLGVKEKEICLAQFEAFKDFHIKLLENIDCENAIALINFVQNWKPDEAFETLENTSGFSLEILNSPNFIFMNEDLDYIHEDEKINSFWLRHKQNKSGTIGRCLISGEEEVIARIHPKIKGIRNAQPAGASLVSFNDKAYESYGKEQSYNAPVSEKSAFKYGTVLNYMTMSGSEQSMVIGGSTVVFWAETAAKEHCQIFNILINPPAKTGEDKIAEAKIRDLLESMQSGKILHECDINPKTNFYILGLVPNNARIAVRFFHRDTFGEMIKKINCHYEDMKIVGSRLAYVPVWLILSETIVKNSKDKTPSPLLSGNVIQAILNGSAYPQNLYMMIFERIRADGDINSTRAGIIKAYLNRKRRLQKEETEDIKMSLDEERKNKGYLLGRLFALLENIQYHSQKNLNATIKDKFFTSASATPQAVFTHLVNLANKHLLKIKKQMPGLAVNRDKEMSGLLNELQDFPANLNPYERGEFILGYYQQRQNFFTKTEAEENITEEV